MSKLINAAQLDKFRKGQKNVAIFDVSYYLNEENRNAHAEFLECHIQGARYLDLNLFHDPHTPLPNMLLRDEDKISTLLAEQGLSAEHKIIFYDNSKLHSSCRAFWMFKVFGHHPSLLYVLDGGLNAWERYGGKTESGEARSTTAKPYPVNFEARYIRTLMQMKTNQHHPAEQVIDARHPVRFAGGVEPRPLLRPGHIPASYSFPFFSMFESDGRFKPIEKISKQLRGVGIDLHYPIVSTCGSGMTAAIINFVLDMMDHEQHALYDGSWSEWGSEQLYPGEESLAERPVELTLDAKNTHL